MTKRREVGHGRLAKRSLVAMLPKPKSSPTPCAWFRDHRVQRLSSMASVCGGSLAMMDAGVPLKNHVAGIAMGLIKDGNRFAVLTDILGDEDHLGDMDFKVTGTARRTALQMDIKIGGITADIMREALAQARGPAGSTSWRRWQGRCRRRVARSSKRAPRILPGEDPDRQDRHRDRARR